MQRILSYWYARCVHATGAAAAPAPAVPVLCVTPPTHTHTHKIFVIRISLLFLPIITVVEKENIEYRQSCNLISGSDHLLFGIIIYFCSTSLDLKDLAQECIGGNM